MSDIKISEKRLKELERIEFKMQCLDIGGVDNWEHYGESLKPYHLQEEEGERLEEFVDDNIFLPLQESAYEPSEIGAGFTFRADAEAEVFSNLREFLKKNYKFISKKGNNDNDL